VTALACAACGGGGRPNPPIAALTVRDGTIRDAQGRQVLLRGVSLANESKTAPGHAPPFGDADLDRIASWGLNTVRFLIFWDGVMPRPGEIDLGYLDLIAGWVARARARGLWVVLDMHQDVFGPPFGGNGAPRWACDESNYATFVPRQPWYLNYGTPEVIACYDDFWASDDLRAKFAEAWAAVAGRVHQEPNVAGFDLYNEPFYGSNPLSNFHRSVLSGFYAQVADAIETLAPGRLYFVEPFPAVSAGLVPLDFPIPYPVPRAVFAPHFYHVQTHDPGRAYDGDPTPIAQGFDFFARSAAELGMPVWLGEYGGSSGNGGFSLYLEHVERAVAERGFGSALWCYCRDESGFGALDSQGRPKPGVERALARPYPRATAGDLVRHFFDPEAGVFRMTWRTVGGVSPSAQTEVALPAVAFPGDLRFSCSGGARCPPEIGFEGGLRVLRVKHDRAAPEHGLEIVRAP
jgi:endoglycosylceramidase